MRAALIPLTVLLVGCFDLASDADPSSCERMVTALCEGACGCAVQDCTHFFDAWSVTYTSQAACEAAEGELWCQDTAAAFDIAACEAALASAACGEDYGVAGLELPAACEGMVSY
jgi:hypothetical protein